MGHMHFYMQLIAYNNYSNIGKIVTPHPSCNILYIRQHAITFELNSFPLNIWFEIFSESIDKSGSSIEVYQQLLSWLIGFETTKTVVNGELFMSESSG